MLGVGRRVEWEESLVRARDVGRGSGRKAL